MTVQVVKALTDPAFLIALLVGIAVFATFFTVMPSLSGNTLKSRMKSVALERDELRLKQRARLAAEADRRRKGLREEQSLGMRAIVDRLDLRRALSIGSPTRKSIKSILESNLDQHPDLFPASQSAPGITPAHHSNVRGADYFRSITTTEATGELLPCSSKPSSIH